MDRKSRPGTGAPPPSAAAPRPAPRLGTAGEAARVARQQRLAAALRANLHRRKAAARSAD